MKHLRRIAALVFLLALACGISAGAGAASAKPDIDQVGGNFSEGLVPYKDAKTKKWGYLDVNGNVAVKAQFSSVNAFHNGYAKVQASGGKYIKNEFIDTKGKVVIRPISTSKRHYDFDDWMGDYAFAEIWEKTKWGSITPVGYNYVNAKGKLITKDEYAYVGRFSEGYAVVGTGYISSSTQYVRSCTSGPDGLTAEHWLAKSDKGAADTYYFIDMNGERLGSYTWAFCRAFCNGYAAVSVKSGSSSLWGFIDSTGAIAVAPAYDEVKNFSEGLAVVKQDGKYGYIDTAGTLVLPLGYDSAASFQPNGYAAVSRDGSAFLIDKEGKEYLTDPGFESAVNIGEDLVVMKKGDSYGAVTLAGENILPAEYQWITCSTEYGWISAKTQEGRIRLFDLKGNRIGSDEWDGVQSSASNENLICVKKGECYGMIDLTGKVVIPASYTSFSAFSGGITMGRMGKNPFYFDAMGRSLLPAITKKSDKASVTKLQEALIAGGYYDGKADGKYSKKVEQAVKDAQTAFGMEATGVADSDFQYRLMK